MQAASQPSGAVCAGRPRFCICREAVQLQGPDPARCGAQREAAAWHGHWKKKLHLYVDSV